MSEEQKPTEPEQPPLAEPSKEFNDRPSTLPKFRLKHGSDVEEIEAIDAIEAVALFNDKRSKWPNPREVTVEPL